jgi:hypothetical protein
MSGQAKDAIFSGAILGLILFVLVIIWDMVFAGEAR